MNPISNLIGKKFDDLTAEELIQVVSSYCDENRYPFLLDKNSRGKEDVIKHFESNFYPIHYLESYFEFWTK